MADKSLDGALREIDTWLNNNPGENLYLELQTKNPGEFEAAQQMIYERCGKESIIVSDGKPDFYVSGNLDNLGAYFIRGFGTNLEKTPWFDNLNNHIAGKQLIEETTSALSEGEKAHVYLDHVDVLSFKEPKIFDTSPGLGPVKLNDTGPAGEIAAGLQGGFAGAAIVGGLLALAGANRDKNEVKRLEESGRKPTEEQKRDIITNAVLSKLSATACVTGGVVSTGALLPALAEEAIGAAGLTALAGVTATAVGARSLSKRLKDIKENKYFDLFAGNASETEPVSNTSEAESVPSEQSGTMSSADGDKTPEMQYERSVDGGARLTQSLAMMTAVTRGAGALRYAAPIMAPVAGGVASGLTLLSVGVSAYRHHHKMSDFVQNPEKAVHHYETLALTQKDYLLFGKSEITRGLDKSLKESEDILEKLQTVTDAPEKIKTGEHFLKLLTEGDDRFLRRELKAKLKDATDDILKLLGDALNISDPKSPFKGKKPTRANIAERLVEQMLKYNKAVGKLDDEDFKALEEKIKTERTETDPPPEGAEKYGRRLQAFWKAFKSPGFDKVDTGGSFKDNFYLKNQARIELRETYLKEAAKDFHKKSEEKYLKKGGGRVGKAARKEIKTELRAETEGPKALKRALQSDDYKEKVSASLQEKAEDIYSAKKEAVKNNPFKIKSRFRAYRDAREEVKDGKQTGRFAALRASFTKTEINKSIDDHYGRKIAKYGLETQEQARIERVRGAIKNEIRRAGYANGLRSAVAVGSLGLVLPPISGPLAVTGAGIGALSAGVSERAGRHKARRWEEEYLRKTLKTENGDRNSGPQRNVSSETYHSRDALINRNDDDDITEYLYDDEEARSGISLYEYRDDDTE